MFKIQDVENLIINVPDFPKKGINFKDITPIFTQPTLFKKLLKQMKKMIRKLDFDIIVSPESRGYLFGLPLSLIVNKPFVFVRKKGKLPRPTVLVSYKLEYGISELEMHKDTIKPGQKILIVDDLLASGGTTNAIEELVKQMGGKVVSSLYLIELEQLNGKQQLSHPALALIKY